MRYAQYPPVGTLDDAAILLVSQGGIMLRVTVAELVAAVPASGVQSVNGDTGPNVVITLGDLNGEIAGTAAAAIATHDSSAVAHGSVAANFAAHVGVGGVAKHPLATGALAGFMPVLSGSAVDTLRGDGTWGAASSQLAVTVQTGPVVYAPGSANRLILAFATAGAVTVTLPAITADMAGQTFIVKAIDVTNAITLNRSSTDTIDGFNSLALTVLYQSVTLIPYYNALGSYWNVV